MATKPYIEKKPGDLIFSQDWNDVQTRIREDISSHKHTGAFDGDAHFLNGSLGFNRVPQDGSLPEGGNASGGRYQLTPRPDRITLESYNPAGTASGGLSILAANGNVGIGRTKPDAPLDVAGENGIRTRVHSGAGNWAGIRNDDQNAYIETFTVNASKYPQNLILKPAGNVGIGTSAPKARLHTVGDIVLGNDTNGQKFILHPRCNGSGDFLYLTCDKPDGSWDWTKSICYGRDGKLGVGAKNTESDALLFVNGNVRVKGTIQPSSSRALKQNILPLDMSTAIGLFEGLDPVCFEYREGADGRRHLGFIAEDVPETLAASDGKAVNALEIIPVLVKTIQELRQRVHRLEQELQDKH